MVENSDWKSIGTVVGNASPIEFSFILKSFKSRVGDIVAVMMEVPDEDYNGQCIVCAWGRITLIDRFNPFFPFEAAQELSNEGISLRDTILSDSRDQLQATVKVLGATSKDDHTNIFPLTYPIQPAADVYYPPAVAIKALLGAGIPGHTPIKIGTLIARTDVEVSISADRVVSRHMAILAMTGGGKTVATRRILRELIDIGYPILIIDPHGDYAGLWEMRTHFPNTEIKLFFPYLRMTEQNSNIIEDLISKMTEGLTPPQRDYLARLLANDQLRPKSGTSVLGYLQTLIQVAQQNAAGAGGRRGRRNNSTEGGTDAVDPVGASTMNAVRRTLAQIEKRLNQMEQTNKKLRETMQRLEFETLPDPEGYPQGIIQSNQVSILYLGGYDHLTQSTIVSILLEGLFEHRASMSGKIPPFQTIIEEAHNFIPSGSEGRAETPSLPTIRRVITEGRKFGTGLILVSQRPSRVDETVLSQCNSFLVLRLVNPKDQSFVRSVMENLDETDARMLPGFGPGQGLVSGQSVRFPLLVKIEYDKDLEHSALGNENFIQQAREWSAPPDTESKRKAAQITQQLTQMPRRGRR